MIRAFATAGTTVAVILAATVTLAGCADTHQDAPDPTSPNTHPGRNEEVIQEPEGFRNVSFACHGTTGVYVTSRGVTTDVITSGITSGIAVLANDPACTS